MSPLFSIIIVNFNGGHFLQGAVDSLKSQTFDDFELIIIDNASSDDSADTVDLRGLKRAQLVRNELNEGFAKANNQAAMLATGRWLALLNPDASAAPDWLAQLRGASRNNPECRVFSSAQYSMDDTSVLDGAGDAYLIFGIPWRGGFGHPVSELPETGLCFSPCGAAAIYDRTLFLEIGGFDERFFCYCEDVDIGFRLQLEGEPCIFVKEATVYHAGSAISGRHSAFSSYHGTRNRIWTYFKDMPLALLLLTLPAHILISVYLIFRSAMFGCFVSTLRGTWHGFRYALKIRSDNQWRPRTRKVSLWSLARSMTWNPLRMNRRQPDVRPLARRTPQGAKAHTKSVPVQTSERPRI
tara:strand:- start:6834 stop:7895 length:1062 start_codon:yes stop_codon:yes gene_type:complete